MEAYLNACTVEEEVWSTWAPSTAAPRILGCTCHRTPLSTRIVEVDPFPAESTRSSPRRSRENRLRRRLSCRVRIGIPRRHPSGSGVRRTPPQSNVESAPPPDISVRRCPIVVPQLPNQRAKIFRFKSSNDPLDWFWTFDFSHGTSRQAYPTSLGGGGRVLPLPSRFRCIRSC